MNLKQALKITEVLWRARHPLVTPSGHSYTNEELSEFRDPYISDSIGYCDGRGDGNPWTIRISLNVDLQNDIDLYIAEDGSLYIWSTIRIPPEDCDCECAANAGFLASKIALRECPQHGAGMRELDCYRHVELRWEVDRKYKLSWHLYAIPGEPIRDVLAEYRAERELERLERVKAVSMALLPKLTTTWVDEEPFNESGYRGPA